MPVLDTFGRPLGALRLSVTDRCNLRCHYCMPQDDYVWLPREALLTFEETVRLADTFAALGVRRVRLTGGEPLLRRNLPSLVAMLAQRPWIEDLALTTNGVLLGDAARPLRDAGLHRLTVSLDTLRPDRFARLTRRDALPDVLAGLDAARRAGFPDLKIDAVISRGDNDDEIVDLLELARDLGAEIRFIEYMDVGGALGWRADAVVTRAEMLAIVDARYGRVAAITPPGSRAPAERFRLPDGLTFGIIASTSQPFCATCDRVRLTADGVMLLCLYAQHGTDLRRPLRAGASIETLRRTIEAVWSSRADRGAEERRDVRDRGVYIPVRALKRDAHLEMHTRGG
ncbi:MAG TPA: GTP 3',8-cyclase MoaA [Vicinamibacterales bacterium]|jgi:cyclic pyranopterin phosphate synthase|nr:GTP 3',8-cyclase MoaA [Vicinamibacterales bacterium]